MSPDGRYLVSSWDKRLCLWRFPEGSLYKVLVPKNRCSFLYEWWFGSIVSFSRDGTSILAMCNDVAYVWVLEEDMKSDIELPANTAFDLSSVSRSYKYLNPDLEVIWMNGNTFAIVSFFSVRVCSFEHGSCHSYDVEVPKGRFVGTFAFAPGSGLLAIGQDSGVSFLSQNEGILRQTVMNLPVTSLSFSPDG
jgi:WD40 repeat protein